MPLVVAASTLQRVASTLSHGRTRMTPEGHLKEALLLSQHFRAIIVNELHHISMAMGHDQGTEKLMKTTRTPPALEG